MTLKSTQDLWRLVICGKKGTEGTEQEMKLGMQREQRRAATKKLEVIWEELAPLGEGNQGAKSKNLGKKSSFWANVHSLNWFAWFSMISSSFIYMKREREIIQPGLTKHLILKGPECLLCQLSKSWKQNLTLFHLQESFLWFSTAFKVSNCL